MMSNRKGITPVIAIVLLLLITVGAVTVVYSQFQSVMDEGDPTEEIEDQQRLQAASYSIEGVQRTDQDTYSLTIRNNGDEVFDLDQHVTVMMGHDGGQEVSLEARGSSCDWDGETQLQPGDTISCDTGIEWDRNEVDDNGEPTTFELQLSDFSQDTYTCTEKSGDEFC